MKKIFLLTLFLFSQIIGMDSGSGENRILRGTGTLAQREKLEDEERAAIRKENIQKIAFSAEQLLDLMKAQARILFGLDAKNKIEQFDLKNFDLNNPSIQRNLSDWNAYFKDVKNIVDRSFMNDGQLKCFVELNRNCQVEDLAVTPLQDLYLLTLKAISDLSQELRKPTLDLDKKYRDYLGTIKEIISRSRKILNYLSKDITKKTANSEHEAKRIIAGVLDIFEKLSKKIEQDFSQEANKRRKEGYKLQFKDVIQEINDKFKDIFNNPIIREDDKIKLWKALLAKINFLVRESGSQKLPAIVDSKEYLANVESFVNILLNVRDSLIKFNQNSTSENSVNITDFKKKYEQNLNNLRNLINKVWTFYSSDQRDAKKILLHLLDKVQEALNIFVQNKIDLSKRYISGLLKQPIKLPYTASESPRRTNAPQATQMTKTKQK